MKRVANKVAVATLLYTMPPKALVTIVDVNKDFFSDSEPWEEADPSVGETLYVSRILHHYSAEKIARASIVKTVVNKNSGNLMLIIDTKNEDY